MLLSHPISLSPVFPINHLIAKERTRAEKGEKGTSRKYPFLPAIWVDKVAVSFFATFFSSPTKYFHVISTCEIDLLSILIVPLSLSFFV